MADCFVASKTPPEHAQQMADLLVEADYRGHFSHGMNRLEMYINDLHAGCTDGHATPALLQQSPATAWVDGRNGLGAVIGNYCMDLAIDKARTVGVGVVTAKGSNHYGIAGWYAMRAQQQGLIGMSMTNTSPLLTPTGSADSALGTNPISFAAPASRGDRFVLDMATTAVALGKVEIQRRKREALPHGWAQDNVGNVTTDAEVAFEACRLMPLGGAEETSGYKGYGLAAMVETLCGVLAGANFATHVRQWSLEGSADPPNLGQFFMAIDPKCFAPSFEDRMSEQNNILRGMKPVSVGIKEYSCEFGWVVVEHVAMCSLDKKRQAGDGSRRSGTKQSGCCGLERRHPVPAESAGNVRPPGQPSQHQAVAVRLFGNNKPGNTYTRISIPHPPSCLMANKVNDISSNKDDAHHTIRYQLLRERLNRRWANRGMRA